MGGLYFFIITINKLRGRTLMTNKVKSSVLYAAVCMVTIVAAVAAMRFAVDASMTLKQKPKRTVAYRRFHPKGVKAPVVIHDLTVDGKEEGLDEIGATKEAVARKVDPTAEFEADDNSFVERIRFKVTNQSDRTIKYIRFMLHFYTQERIRSGNTGNFDLGLVVDYGHTPMPKDSPSETPLGPGRTATIATDSVPDPLLKVLREDMAKLNAEIVRVGIVINTVTFEDDTEWYFDGTTGKPRKISLQGLPKPGGIGDNAQIANACTVRDNAYQPPSPKTSSQTLPVPFLTFLPLAFILGEVTVPPEAAKSTGTLPQCPPGYCFTHDGSEPLDCAGIENSPPNPPYLTCYGTREFWYDNPDTNRWTIQLAPPIPCYYTPPNQNVFCTFCGRVCTVAAACSGGSSGDTDGDGDGYTPNQGDCNDTNRDINPGAHIYCTTEDRNCNNQADYEEPSCDNNSPIIIDVDGNGIDLTNPANGVNFDLNSNGPPERLSWTSTGSDDAWLALDRNGNGKFDSGQELFGNFTPQPSPPQGQSKNGFLALAEFDRLGNGGNGDGQIDNRDSIFSSLRLWQDTNHNGISEPAEIHKLPELGVTSLNLDYKISSRMDQYGNLFKYRAKVRDVHGSQVGRWSWDVFLVRQ
jgi:hypothetical protein